MGLVTPPRETTTEFNERNETMIKTFTQGFKKKLNEAKSNLQEKIDELFPKIDEVMLEHLANGYFGFELLRDPFLWREECLDLVTDVGKKLNDAGYKLVMNSLYHTVTIVPPQEVGERIQADFSVGISGATQLIHYTLEDQNVAINKVWKADKDNWCERVHNTQEDLKEKMVQVWYAPGMPGYFVGEQAFKESTQKGYKNEILKESQA